MLIERVGVLGGGQLARMMVPCAHRLGLELRILERFPGSPAARAGAIERVGDWSDSATVTAFALEVDRLTLDHEFVPAEIIPEEKCQPSRQCLAVIQDKFHQKQRLAQLGLPVPDFQAVQDRDELDRLGKLWEWPVVVKARRNAYDGKGNWLVHAASDLPEEAWQRPGGLYVERFVGFNCELAVMAVRDQAGHKALYPVVRTEQQDHICHRVLFPAGIEAPIRERAQQLAALAADAVGCVGALGVEMFLLDSGEILVNELAPRPHNSGHYTIEACQTSQFENHLRAVAGLPLGDTSPRVESAVMVNLLADGEGGGRPRGLEHALAIPGVSLHLYQKDGARPGRKMGHLTVTSKSLDQAMTLAGQAARSLTFRGAP